MRFCLVENDLKLGVLIKLVSKGLMEDPLRDIDTKKFNEYQLFVKNKKMLGSMRQFLEKASGCFNALHELENSVTLKPYSLIFALRLFEKARFNLCQANYSAIHLRKLIGDGAAKSNQFKITRRWQEFENKSKDSGQTSMINSCLRSVQFFKYGNKQVGHSTAYE